MIYGKARQILHCWIFNLGDVQVNYPYEKYLYLNILKIRNKVIYLIIVYFILKLFNYYAAGIITISCIQ